MISLRGLSQHTHQSYYTYIRAYLDYLQNCLLELPCPVCRWTSCYFFCQRQKSGETRKTLTLTNLEFIRRYLMHVLPPCFLKIRYYGFLNNRYKFQNLKLIFTIQEHQRLKTKYSNLSMVELLKAVWNIIFHICPEYGCCSM